MRYMLFSFLIWRHLNDMSDINERRVVLHSPPLNDRDVLASVLKWTHLVQRFVPPRQGGQTAKKHPRSPTWHPLHGEFKEIASISDMLQQARKCYMSIFVHVLSPVNTLNFLQTDSVGLNPIELKSNCWIFILNTRRFGARKTCKM